MCKSSWLSEGSYSGVCYGERGDEHTTWLKHGRHIDRIRILTPRKGEALQSCCARRIDKEAFLVASQYSISSLRNQIGLGLGHRDAEHNSLRDRTIRLMRFVASRTKYKFGLEFSFTVLL